MTAAEFSGAILLPPSMPDFREVVYSDGSKGGIRDASYIEFIVADLVANSATRLAIDRSSVFYGSADVLPRSLRGRVIEVDRNAESVEKVAALMVPVFADFGLEFVGTGALHVPDGAPRGVAHDLLGLADDLRRLLIGLDSRLQVEGNAADSVEAAVRLRAKARSSQVRGTLADLEGIFRCYAVQQAPALEFRSTATKEQAELFARLVEDELYCSMASERGAFGDPIRWTHALIRLRRLATDLLSRPNLAARLSLAVRPVEVVSKIPIPDAKAVATVLGKERFLPPLVSLREAEMRAAEQWREIAPPLVVPAALRGLVGPDIPVTSEPVALPQSRSRS